MGHSGVQLSTTPYRLQHHSTIFIVLFAIMAIVKPLRRVRLPAAVSTPPTLPACAISALANLERATHTRMPAFHEALTAWQRSCPGPMRTCVRPWLLLTGLLLAGRPQVTSPQRASPASKDSKDANKMPRSKACSASPKIELHPG